MDINTKQIRQRKLPAGKVVLAIAGFLVLSVSGKYAFLSQLDNILKPAQNLAEAGSVKSQANNSNTVESSGTNTGINNATANKSVPVVISTSADRGSDRLALAQATQALPVVHSAQSTTTASILQRNATTTQVQFSVVGVGDDDELDDEDDDRGEALREEAKKLQERESEHEDNEDEDD